MKISRKWVEQFVDLSGITDEDIALRLTMLGLEVESYENLARKYDGFVIGSVLEVEKHPNADKLTVCKVDIGGETRSIVCGAPNVAAGQKVPVGLVGAVVPHDQHDPEGKPFTLTTAKIRGVESEGMICSAAELGLGDDKSGILVFEDDAAVGKPLAEHLGVNDTVLDVSLTPNRGDCLSHLGVARELAAAFSKKITHRKPTLHETETPVTDYAKVEVTAHDLCPRYSARVITEIAVRPSPRWLKNAVEKVGMRSINNIVDATNYVMLELGQPLHAFDLSLLTKHKIVVRRPKPGESSFKTLDEKERKIDQEMLMICDAEKTVAIGGVMGGMNSEIRPETTSILIESANFSASSVRKTSKALGLSTEASYRFERGVDPNLTVIALDRVSDIIADTSGGKIAQGIIDVAEKKFGPARIELHVERINMLLGTRLASGEIKKSLDSIGIICERKSDTVLTCFVPTYRGDIEREVDLIEEVGRLYGYEKIEDSLQTRLVFDTRFGKSDPDNGLRDFLAGAGFNEIVTNSLQPASIAGSSARNYVRLANPISEDMAAMRTSLLPGALQTVSRNLSYGMKNMKLFEIGRIYSESDKKQTVGNFLEQTTLSLAITGASDPVSFDRKETPFDIFDLKTEMERVMRHLNLDNWDIISYDTTEEYEQPLKLIVNGTEVGTAGRVSRTTLERFSIEQDVCFAELDLSQIISAREKAKRYRPLPRFPFASVDLAFIVDSDAPVAGIIKSIRESGSELCRDIRLFDIYAGEGIPEGKKSVAFTVVLGSDERTLNDIDVSKFIEGAEIRLREEFSAVLRRQKS